MNMVLMLGIWMHQADARFIFLTAINGITLLVNLFPGLRLQLLTIQKPACPGLNFMMTNRIRSRVQPNLLALIVWLLRL